MDSNISIVTAFFNINRDNWKYFNKSEDKYFEQFKKWAIIRNQMVVYVESEELRDRILNFRKNIGLNEYTKVIIIDDCTVLETELYHSLQKVSCNKISQLYRYRKGNPEVWSADYNYVMMMKFWCVCDAIKNKYCYNNQIAWVDFGYGHGNGERIGIEEPNSFEWKFAFPDKICLFTIQNMDDRPMFDIIFSMDTYVKGETIIAPKNLWPDFWKSIKENMLKLNEIGIMDDDQSLMLMCYRQNENNFAIFESEWSSTMRKYNVCYKSEYYDLSVENASFLRKILRFAKKRHRDNQFIRGLKKYAYKQRSH